MSERIYRDPVHNIIRLRTDTDEGELMMRLIDTPEFQRLRRIKQLGLGLYTYQGAEHSRFTHPLGAVHLMSSVLDRVSEKYTIDKDERSARHEGHALPDRGRNYARAVEGADLRRFTALPVPIKPTPRVPT